MIPSHNDPLGYYQELETSVEADPKTIKQNYRNIAKKWHPDYNDSAEALEKFQKISVAYEILQDEKTRLRYDLLSQVYQKNNFPDMFSLKVYKNQKGREDPAVRTLVLKQFGKENKYVCTYKEAKWLVLKNFLIDFWHIKEVLFNYKNLRAQTAEDLKLLIHNAIAYEEEGKKEEAAMEALAAMEDATGYQKSLLNRFIGSLGLQPKSRPARWNYKELKLIFLSPLFVLLALLAFFLYPASNPKLKEDAKKINYYQEVRFKTGGETVDDVVVSKILSFPVDVTDYNMLYRTTANANVMYGPSTDFDLITKLEPSHTVRVTGISPDKAWYRVMLDNGDMGFIESKYLEPGMGSPIPPGSKILQER